MVVWGSEVGVWVLDWVSRGEDFSSVDGVWGLWCGGLWVLWKWGSLYKHRRINLGKNQKLCAKIDRRFVVLFKYMESDDTDT